MILHPPQDQIALDRHRFRVVNCGRRFGKTTLAVLEMVAKAYAGKDRNICYVAPTYAQARDIAWQDLKKVCLPIAYKVNESRLEITIHTQDKGLSVISLRGWESIETLRGQRFHFIVIDEIASMRNWVTNWEEVIRPTLTDYKGEVLFISTPKGFNHFYDLFNKELTDSDYKSFHFSSYDNPHLPVEELNKAKQELTEDRFAQEYMADFRKTEGLVYKEFDRSIHLFEELPMVQFVDTLAGVDFGFTHPAAVPTIKKDYDGNYWMTEEWYKVGQTDLQIAEYVASRKFNKVYPDPENAGGIQELKNHGVNVREVTKGSGSVVTGINIVREMFKSNKLRIHKSCIYTIGELETYSYPPKKPGSTYDNENPLKENDDMMDSIRYVLMMDGTASQAGVPVISYSQQRKTYGTGVVDLNRFRSQ